MGQLGFIRQKSDVHFSHTRQIERKMITESEKGQRLMQPNAL
jgi:hypothetical protein